MKKTRIFGLAALVLVWIALIAASWFGTPEEMSESERRKLAQFPDLTAQTLLSGDFMEDFESYTLDQFPLRDTFRRLKALVHYNLLGQKDNNDIYIAAGYAAQLEYPLDESSVANALEKFNRLYEKYLDGSKVVVTVAPDKGYWLAEENGYLSMNYEALFSAVQEGMPWAEFVDLTDCLDITSYYCTDTHWRQEKITDAAQKLCEALNAASFESEELTFAEVEQPFYGVYHGQAALPMEAETMYVLENGILENCTVYNHETGETLSVIDRSKLDGNDPYEMFLSGPVSLLTIENSAAETDRELIVFRDSFGSSMIPLLLKDYARVTVVDIRYISSDLLGQFIDFHGQDVLFLYSTLVLNNSNFMK